MQSPAPSEEKNMHQYNLGTNWLESIFAGKASKVLVSSKLATGQECGPAAKKANTLGSGGILSIYIST